MIATSISKAMRVVLIILPPARLTQKHYCLGAKSA